MPGISTTYLLPAIILNPAFILHLINTFFSHYMPPPPTISYSPHPFMESLGPLPGTTLALDMHANDQLCWGYTAIMVIAQVFAFGKVSDNRIARKAARLERERLRKEKLEKMAETKAPTTNGHIAGVDGASEVAGLEFNGNGHTNGKAMSGTVDKKDTHDLSGEESMIETSEEEMMI
jgi:hypothetical protein